MKRRNFLRNSIIGVVGVAACGRIDKDLVGNTSSEGSFELKRKIVKEEEYDIVVVGGGMAGAVAAITAGRTGAKTLLIENIGSLGGMATNGYVCAWDGMADGEKNIIGGVMLELAETMFANDGMSEWDNGDSFRKDFLSPTRIKPEVLRRTFDKMVLDAGVEVRYFTKLVEVESDKDDKRVNGIVVAQVDGLRYIPAKSFIDATGDAILSQLAGADYWQAGRDSKQIMPPTLCGMYSGTRWTDEKFSIRGRYNQAVADGFFKNNDEARFNQFLVSIQAEDMRTLNGGHIFYTDGVNQASQTNAMIEGRKLSEEYAEFMRKYLPGYEKAELSGTANLLGVRETRRIIGEYSLTFDDFKARRQFPDQIGVFNKEVDIHPYEPTEKSKQESREFFEDIGLLKAGEVYGLPYGMLVPKGWKNLWAAGRCVSGDSIVSSSYRVMPGAAMFGQAAGMAAAQAINNNETANNLNTSTLITSLREINAYLPQTELSDKMTRG